MINLTSYGLFNKRIRQGLNAVLKYITLPMFVYHQNIPFYSAFCLARSS